MTTAIGDIQDLFRILDDDPEQLAELRRRVLGEALLNLPERFDRFVDEQHQFNDEQHQFNDEQRRFNDEQRRFNDEQLRFNERIDRFVDEQHQFNDEQRRFNERIDRFVDEQHQFNDEQRRFNERIDRFVAEQTRFNDEQRRFNDEVRRDLGQFRGTYAREVVVRRSLLIALRMGLQRERILTDDDLMAMVKAADTQDISPSAIESFISADLVMEATDGDGQTVYVAMEISYTANRRDTGRAMRNAELLARFTGQSARAAVASVRNDPEIAYLIDGRQVYWHEIRDRDLEPE